jgi:ribosomal protein S18 acetylase RimI-like enzyme
MITTRPYCAKDWKLVSAITEKSFKKTYDKGYLKTLVNDPKRIITVAVRRKKVVGYSVLSVEGLGYLNTIAVIPHSRRTGIGATLMAAAEKCAKQHGCTMLHLDIHVNGPLKWYQKRGFRVARENGFMTFKDGTKSRLLVKPLFMGTVHVATAKNAAAIGK